MCIIPFKSSGHTIRIGTIIILILPVKIHRHRKAKLLFQDHKAWGRKMSLFKNTMISKLQYTLNHPKDLTKITGNHELLSDLVDLGRV